MHEVPAPGRLVLDPHLKTIAQEREIAFELCFRDLEFIEKGALRNELPRLEEQALAVLR